MPGRRAAGRSRRWAAVVLAAWAAGAQGQSGAPGVEPLAVSQVAPGVYVQFGQQDEWLPRNGGNVSNIGFIVGSRCVAVIDTGGSVELGRRLRAAVARATPLPVCYVINTHAHPDHLLGNAAFVERPGQPVFVAHAKLAAALAARERYYLNALERDFGQTPDRAVLVYPSLAVDQTTELELGGRTLVLRAWPTAHTDHDLTVYDPQTKTLLLGDLLFVGHMPVLDGNLRGWLAVMAELERIDVKLAVPGHGPASADWPGVLAPQRRYLTALQRETRAAIKAGTTIDRAVEQVGREAAGAWLLGETFHRRNVTVAYAELEWED